MVLKRSVPSKLSFGGIEGILREAVLVNIASAEKAILGILPHLPFGS